MRRSLSYLVGFFIVLGGAAQAQVTDLTPVTDRDDMVAMLAAYAGNWTGRGESRSDFDDELEASACRLETVFDAATETLINDGACATAARSIDVDGNLTVTPAGELTGGYFGQFEQAELLESNGAVYEEGFIVNARYALEIRQEVRELDIEIRVGVPILRDNGQTQFSMVVLVLDPDTNEYVEFSVMRFTLDRDL